MGAKEITDSGNTFLVRFAIVLLVVHFVVVAPTFNPPPKVHAVIADAKNLMNKQKVSLIAGLDEHERKLVSMREYLADINSRAARGKEKGQLAKLRKEKQKVDFFEDQIIREKQTVPQDLLKLDHEYLEFEKARAPRQFAIPGVTTIDEHDILKLYPGVICFGLLQLLRYRRQLIKSGGPVGDWPVWAAPIPFVRPTQDWSSIAVNLAWTTLLGLLFFLYRDVAHREEFYASSRMFVVNLLLVGAVITWYAAAFVRALYLSVWVPPNGAMQQ